MFVYGPDVNNVEAELRALQQTAAEKNCPANVTKAPAKPEPGMGADPLTGTNRPRSVSLPGLTGQSSTHGRCLLDRPVKAGR